jgi:hypothetical protein
MASQVTNFVFDNNKMVGNYLQTYCNKCVISNNQFTTPATITAGIITSLNSTLTHILWNNMDGGWDGDFANRMVEVIDKKNAGSDDGIILWDEEAAVIENNTIQNVWDCGVENLGLLKNSTIRNNHIVTVGYCGIGGWYWSSLIGNNISFNKVENGWRILEYQRDGALRPSGWDSLHLAAADTAIYFKDNVFEGNELVPPVKYPFDPDFSVVLPVYNRLFYNGSSRPLPGEVAPTDSQFIFWNNVFKNNVFGLPSVAPWFGDPGEDPRFGSGLPVPGYIIDGGGNVCQQPWPFVAKDYPLKCNDPK